MNGKHAYMSKEAINAIVPKVKDFWLSDDAVDFMTKVAYLDNGYYVPTQIDSDLDYDAKCDEPKRPSKKELIHYQLVNVFMGHVPPEEALETIKKEFLEYEHPVAKSEDDE